jgi:hypothetical protein
MPAGKFFFSFPPLDRVIEKRKEISRSRRLVVPFLLFSRVAACRSSLDKALVKKKPDLGAAEAGKMGGEEEILARGSFFFSTSRLTQVPVVFCLVSSTSTASKQKNPQNSNSTADLAAGMEQLRLNPDATEFVPPSGGAAGASGYHHHHHHQQQSYAMMLGGGGGGGAPSSSGASGTHAAPPSNGNGGGRGANGSSDAGFFHQQQHFGGNGNGSGRTINGSHHTGSASTSGHSHHHHYGGHLTSGNSNGFGAPPPLLQPGGGDLGLGGTYRRGKGDARAKAVQRRKNSVQKALEEAGAVQRTVR